MVTEELIKGNNKIIDWEQRRYEVAKEIYCNRLSEGTNVPEEMVASRAIKLADVLIQKLRE